MFMQTGIGDRARSFTVHFSLALFLFAAASTSLLAADNSGAAEEARLSKSQQFSETASAESGTETNDAFQALVTEGKRSAEDSEQSSGKLAPPNSAQQSSGFDFWIYSADVDLFYDDDWDGFYHGIDLRFDADTIWGVADVYAAVYLSFEGGPWNQYVVTNDFTIFGTSGVDDYVIETELLSGYPTGYYDLLIELFDAWDGSYLASYGPIDSSELSFLPLESANRDDPFPGGGGVSVRRGGGGAIGWLLLALVLLARRRLAFERNQSQVS